MPSMLNFCMKLFCVYWIYDTEDLLFVFLEKHVFIDRKCCLTFSFEVFSDNGQFRKYYLLCDSYCGCINIMLAVTALVAGIMHFYNVWVFRDV